MAKSPRIAVMGSANIDLTTFTDRFPKPGETIFGQKFDLGFGGKGANQAVASKLCGAEVFMVARVGSDLFGPATIENFKKLGIDATHVKQVRRRVQRRGADFCRAQRAEPHFRGEGRERRAETGRRGCRGRSAQGCRLHRAAVRNSPRDGLLHRRVSRRKNGIRCILNPAPAQPIDIEALAGLDYFVPNESEAETITGMPVQNVEDAKKCAEKLLGLRHQAGHPYARAPTDRCWPARMAWNTCRHFR